MCLTCTWYISKLIFFEDEDIFKNIRTSYFIMEDHFVLDNMDYTLRAILYSDVQKSVVGWIFRYILFVRKFNNFLNIMIDVIFIDDIIFFSARYDFVHWLRSILNQIKTFTRYCRTYTVENNWSFWAA